MIAAGKVVFRWVLLSLMLPLAWDRARAQIQPAQPQPAGPRIGTIHGVVKSGTMPIPGAQVSSRWGPPPRKLQFGPMWTVYSAAVPSLWLLHRSCGDDRVRK
jgi:hypothetical protein